jgi:hypothetical protein
MLPDLHKKIKWGIGIVAVIAIAVYAVWFRAPVPEYGFASVAFQENGYIVQAYTPKNAQASAKGLGGRSVLPEDYGMLWRFDPAQIPSFTMKGMRIPLDFIWIQNDKVVEITANVPVSQEMLMPKLPVDAVLEVNAGFTRKNSISVGDSLQITDSAWSSQ